MLPVDSNLAGSQVAAAGGLPPVEPPSGRFIVQLFVVPGVIVIGVVLFLMAIFYVTTSRSPEYYLRQLDSANTDIRWRAASDLAQILKRPESGSQKWKADALFGLELAERLRVALDELHSAEEAAWPTTEKPSAAEQDAASHKLAPLRNHVSFLVSALGDLNIPVGVPLLAKICLYDGARDLKGNTLLRRKALWSLANLGANTAAFGKLPAEKQASALAVLRSEAEGTTPRATWARTALFYVEPRSDFHGDVVRADEVLAACAKAEDRFLREQVALAFNFWDGPDAERTLVDLVHDDGHGTLVRVTEPD